MIILHYFLGFPPYRTGGLTKYAFDLMQAQVEDGNTVVAFWPGKIGIVNHRTTVKKRGDINGIQSFELLNPLPVSLDEGITDFEAYTKDCNFGIYESFLKRMRPNVIHVHTLMGLHKEFFEAAIKLKIRTVFTTHDYFGICPKVTLYRNDMACINDHGCKDCIQCNYSALSLKKIMIMQSPLYRVLKNFPLIKHLRKQHRKDFFSNIELPEMLVSQKMVEDMAEKYRNLREYYIYILEHMDCIHFNSSVAEAVYKKYLIPKSSVVMNITHNNIADNREKNEWKRANKLRITFLAPAKPFKGFNVLQTALDELWSEGKQDFQLKLFSSIRDMRPYMITKEDGFQQSDLPNIFADTDVLVAPSIWYETFGFTVLEAISYGVPVIVSDRVGAKDIIGHGGLILPADDIEELKKAFVKIWEKNLIPDMRRSIRENNRIVLWKDFVKLNYNLYKT